MDGSGREIAQLRSGFRGAAKIASAKFALCRFDRTAEASRSVDERASRSRDHRQRRILRAGRFGSRRRNTGRNRARNRFGNPTRLRKRIWRFASRTKDADPPNQTERAFAWRMAKVAAVILAAGESAR